MFYGFTPNWFVNWPGTEVPDYVLKTVRDDELRGILGGNSGLLRSRSNSLKSGDKAHPTPAREETTMARRNFSMQAYWEEQVENFTPRLHFDSQKMDWENWRRTAHAKYMELLGSFPDPVPLDAEIESSVEDDGLIRERVVFNSRTVYERALPGSAPQDNARRRLERRHLCSHGHGPFGKDPVAGIRSSDEMRANIEMHNYDYGWQMAKARLSDDLTRPARLWRTPRRPRPVPRPRSVQCQLYTRHDARPLAADAQHLGHEMLRRLPGERRRSIPSASV